jgi:acetyl-CoA C-acetyltransferase
MAVVVAARRTPIARLDGELARVSAEELVVPLVAALLADVGRGSDDVDDLILGNAAGPPGNLARRAALLSGLGHPTPGLTVDRQCAAGLEAVLIACRMVDAGAAELVLAGGTESASTSPRRAEPSRDPTRTGRALFPRAAFAPEGSDDLGMAEAAETVAETFGITRERQDAYAARSQARHTAAEAAGRFVGERVPCGPATADTCPRPRMTPERLARVAPLVREGGTVTAGNSCPISDGAALVAVCSDRMAAAHGLRGLRLIDACTVGIDPALCGIGPVPAVERLLARNLGRSLRDAASIELTEAFAAQVLACADALGLPDDQLNRNGGAIALGHPWGASGAVLVVRTFADLASHAGRWGITTAAVAGGMGTAAMWEAT